MYNSNTNESFGTNKDISSDSIDCKIDCKIDIENYEQIPDKEIMDYG